MKRSCRLPLPAFFVPVVVCVVVSALLLPGLVAAAGIVDHPDKLSFVDLNYEPPQPADHRHVLASGATAYVAENREVPTLEVTVLVRTGSLYEPVEKAGLAEITGYLMRNGGVTGLTAGELDERLAYLAGEISVGIGESQGQARLFCLAKDMDEGLDLLMRVLRTPVFDAQALERYRTDLLSEMEQRNSSTAAIENREWQFLMYGDHPCTNRYRSTEQSVRSITREDLVAFHDTYFFPRNFIFAVSGDFETAEILAKLNRMLAGWPDRALDLPPVADQIADPQPGVYMIKKDDVNQSRVRVGHVGVKRDIPDEYALMVMNDILGGGGFTSRIVRRVRSDEGLAYNTGSAFDRPVLYPGTFRSWFQTKHATAAFGTRLIVDEIRRICAETCDEEAVANAKAGFVSGIVNSFGSQRSTVETFADDQYTRRADGYWQNYRRNIEAVTPDDVLAAARKYLHPDRLVFLVVGDPDAVLAGSDKHDERFADFGPVTILPLRDPMTLEAPPVAR
ncbi:MAG: pitrilysin family protein [Candidatus Eisenbacteria bacterium]